MKKISKKIVFCIESIDCNQIFHEFFAFLLPTLSFFNSHANFFSKFDNKSDILCVKDYVRIIHKFLAGLMGNLKHLLSIY